MPKHAASSLLVRRTPKLQASLDSILPQGLSGMELGGATRGKIAGKQRNQEKQEAADRSGD